MLRSDAHFSGPSTRVEDWPTQRLVHIEIQGPNLELASSTSTILQKRLNCVVRFSFCRNSASVAWRGLATVAMTTTTTAEKIQKNRNQMTCDDVALKSKRNLFIGSLAANTQMYVINKTKRKTDDTTRARWCQFGIFGPLFHSIFFSDLILCRCQNYCSTENLCVVL